MPRSSTAADNNAVTGWVTSSAFFNANTADPGTTGANEVSGGTNARVALAWASASGGAIANSGALSVNIPASTSVSFFSDWSLITAGVYQQGGALGTTLTFTTAGVLTVAVGALSLSGS